MYGGVFVLISASLKENLEYFNTQFDGSMDFVVRKFKITDSDAALLTLDNMVNKQTIAQSILNHERFVHCSLCIYRIKLQNN